MRQRRKWEPEVHLGPACSTQTDMVLARAKIIRPSTHPSTSASSSLWLSVFHHPISKPDPHVKPVPTPSTIRSAGPSQLRLVLDGIPNMQLSDPPFAESGKQWQRGQARDCLGNKQDPAPFTPPPPTLLFDIIFQLSAFAPCHFFSSISITLCHKFHWAFLSDRIRLAILEESPAQLTKALSAQPAK